MIVANWITMRSLFATGVALDVDGVSTWPIGSVRPTGFNSGFTGIATPITAFPITVTIGGSVDHHAYLSQRTDDGAAQYLTLAIANATTDAWTISLTALAVSDLGLASATAAVDTGQLTLLLRDVTLYVQRISDDAIQLVNLLDATLA